MLKRLIIIALFTVTACYTHAQVTIVMESLPAATPVADTIFLCGSFNAWITNDSNLALQRQLNGQLAITIQLPPGQYEFKFTRGAWTKVETDPENRYTKNRIVNVAHEPVILTVKVENWLDLGGARPLNYVIFYFFACAFQSMALCLLVLRVQKRDHVKIRSFLLLNSAFTVLLFLVVFLEFTNQILQTYLSFVFQVSFFCWGPLFLYFFYSFSGKTIRRLHLYFIPAVLAMMVVTVRLLNVQVFAFLSNILSPPVTWSTGFFVFSGFIFNAFIYFRLVSEFVFLRPRSAEREEPKKKLLYTFFWISWIGLVLVPVNLLLLINGVHYPSIEDFHSVAIILSGMILAETYFLWRYPEVLREEKVASSAPVDYSPELVNRLKELMAKEKPFRKADLTVSDLAALLGTKPHVLSRIINDQYDRNFRDFLNAYRIEEFIALANTKEFRHFTFLALAQEVGFNSKSTFNLAFKKLTNKSPREYFKHRE